MVQSGEASPDLESELNKIAEKVPILDALQNKIQEFKELDPELAKVSKQLDYLTDFSDMDAARLGGNTIRQIYHAQDLPTSQPVKEMIKSQIMHNYEVEKAGIHLGSHMRDIAIAHNEAVKSTLPSLASTGEMSNFLGAATATTTGPDIEKMVAESMEKHHIAEKMTNLKQI
jgi:hypothetical protein